MKGLALYYILLGVLGLLTGFSYLWLWYLVKRPEKWAAWIERENNFWVRHGAVSASFAEQVKRQEKGISQKLLVGGCAVLGTVVLLLCGYILLRHG